jgi:uncharacterized phage protein (TIGR01671 family)
MSREIKFRAWRKVIKTMQYFDTIAFLESSDDVLTYTKQPSEEPHGIDELTDDVLMQYTGLKDKNGKEIYEGDILEFNDFDSLRTGGHTEDNIIRNKVCFSCGTWIVKTENGFYDLYSAIVNDEELEVIGNIYENQELLKLNK